MFWLLTKLPYEKIRIPYKNEKGKESIYIVDFHDPDNKILYEVKPKSNKSNKRVKLKEEYALKWCEENKYTFIYITEDYLTEHRDKLVYMTDNDKIIESIKRLK